MTTQLGVSNSLCSEQGVIKAFNKSCSIILMQQLESTFRICMKYFNNVLKVKSGLKESPS